MRVIGLTGGIASGKSTVARLLAELGAPIIDADQIAREVVEPGEPALEELVHAFGAEVLGADGRLDRKRLGKIVFGDAARRRSLDAITHPRIAARTQDRLAALRAGGAPVAIYEAALLVETEAHRGLDGLIVVAVDEPTQLARLVDRDGLDPDEARARVAAQAPLSDKIAAADWVIRNDGSPEETRGQVLEVWQEILGGGDR